MLSATVIRRLEALETISQQGKRIMDVENEPSQNARKQAQVYR